MQKRTLVRDDGVRLRTTTFTSELTQKLKIDNLEELTTPALGTLVGIEGYRRMVSKS